MDPLKQLQVQADIINGSHEVIADQDAVIAVLNKRASELVVYARKLENQLATVRKSASDLKSAAERGRISADVVKATVSKLAEDGHLAHSQVNDMVAKIESSPETLCTIAERLSAQLAKRALEMPQVSTVARPTSDAKQSDASLEAWKNLGDRLGEEMRARQRR